MQIGPGQYEVRLTRADLVVLAERDPRAGRLDGALLGDQQGRRARTHDSRHNINVMVLPGQIAHAPARFDTPGEYPIICHEYCGIAHHTMGGKIIVEAKP